MDIETACFEIFEILLYSIIYLGFSAEIFLPKFVIQNYCR